MITDKDRLTNQLLACIYPDSKDKSVLRVNFDNILKIFASFSYNLPSTKFGDALEKLLNGKMYGAKITPGLKVSMAELIIQLANMMHVSDEQIINYYKDNEFHKEISQEAVNNWRKEYYGKMSQSDKEALLEAMQGKLRPQVIEEIKKA